MVSDLEGNVLTQTETDTARGTQSAIEGTLSDGSSVGGTGYSFVRTNGKIRSTATTNVNDASGNSVKTVENTLDNGHGTVNYSIVVTSTGSDGNVTAVVTTESTVITAADGTITTDSTSIRKDANDNILSVTTQTEVVAVAKDGSVTTKTEGQISDAEGTITQTFASTKVVGKAEDGTVTTQITKVVTDQGSGAVTTTETLQTISLDEGGSVTKTTREAVTEKAADGTETKIEQTTTVSSGWDKAEQTDSETEGAGDDTPIDVDDSGETEEKIDSKDSEEQSTSPTDSDGDEEKDAPDSTSTDQPPAEEETDSTSTDQQPPAKEETDSTSTDQEPPAKEETDGDSKTNDPTPPEDEDKKSNDGATDNTSGEASEEPGDTEDSADASDSGEDTDESQTSRDNSGAGSGASSNGTGGCVVVRPATYAITAVGIDEGKDESDVLKWDTASTGFSEARLPKDGSTAIIKATVDGVTNTEIGTARFASDGVRITLENTKLGAGDENGYTNVSFTYTDKANGDTYNFTVPVNDKNPTLTGYTEETLKFTKTTTATMEGTVTNPQKVAKVSFGSDGFYRDNAVGALSLVCTKAEDNSGEDIADVNELTTKDLGSLAIDDDGCITFVPNANLGKGKYDVTMTARDGDGSSEAYDFSFIIGGEYTVTAEKIDECVNESVVLSSLTSTGTDFDSTALPKSGELMAVKATVDGEVDTEVGTAEFTEGGVLIKLTNTKLNVENGETYANVNFTYTDDENGNIYNFIVPVNDKSPALTEYTGETLKFTKTSETTVKGRISLSWEEVERAASEDDREDIWDSLSWARKIRIDGSWYGNALTDAEIRANGTELGVAEFTDTGVRITVDGTQLGVVNGSIDVDINYNYLAKILGMEREWDWDDENVLLPFDDPAKALLNVARTVTDPQKVAKVSFGSDGFFKTNEEDTAVDALGLVCTGAKNNAEREFNWAEGLTAEGLGDLAIDNDGWITFVPKENLSAGVYTVALTAKDGDGSITTHEFSFIVDNPYTVTADGIDECIGESKILSLTSAQAGFDPTDLPTSVSVPVKASVNGEAGVEVGTAVFASDGVRINLTNTRLDVESGETYANVNFTYTNDKTGDIYNFTVPVNDKNPTLTEYKEQFL